MNKLVLSYTNIFTSFQRVINLLCLDKILTLIFFYRLWWRELSNSPRKNVPGLVFISWLGRCYNTFYTLVIAQKLSLRPYYAFIAGKHYVLSKSNFSQFGFYLHWKKHFTPFQALFAGSIPEIISIFKSFPKYNGVYVSDPGRRQEECLVLVFYSTLFSALT